MNPTADPHQPLYVFERAHELALWRPSVELDGYDASRYHLKRHDAIDDAEPVKRRQRKPSLRTRIKQAEKAGLTIAAIKPDGTLIIGSKPALTPIGDNDDVPERWH